MSFVLILVGKQPESSLATGTHDSLWPPAYINKALTPAADNSEVAASVGLVLLHGRPFAKPGPNIGQRKKLMANFLTVKCPLWSTFKRMKRVAYEKCAT